MQTGQGQVMIVPHGQKHQTRDKTKGTRIVCQCSMLCIADTNCGAICDSGSLIKISLMYYIVIIYLYQI